MSTYRSKTLVSIITVNWNGLQVTCDLLRSIVRKNTYSNIEVIVVDNNSEEDPTDRLLEIYPNVKVIRNQDNLGFSGGNNVGIKAAKGDFLFLVNNDTELTPGVIEGLLAVFTEYPDAGVACPKFHYYYEKGTIEYAGYHPVNIFTGRNGMVGWREKDFGQYDEVRITNYAHGGAMMVPKAVVEVVGLMYEPFFLYYEELDWSMQIRRKGYKIYYQPTSLIYHKESMTTGKLSPLKTYYTTRNRILFMKRNVPLVSFIIFLLYFALFSIPKNTIEFILRKQKEHLTSFWRAIFWHVNKKFAFNQGGLWDVKTIRKL